MLRHIREVCRSGGAAVRIRLQGTAWQLHHWVSSNQELSDSVANVHSYIPQGATSPDEYPKSIYGTEVFEVNDNLRQLAIGFAKTAQLNDSEDAITYRANYAQSDAFTAGSQAPLVLGCDAATSDVYFSGTLLSESFESYTKLATNGSGTYCLTAQEDNATLEALLRAASHKLVDFARIIILRTASDYDREYPGQESYTNLFYAEQGAFEPAIQNIYLAGVKVVQGILSAWETTFKGGIPAGNYIGDIFGTLGGTPDFGLPGYDPQPLKRRMRKRNAVGGVKWT